MKWRKLGLVYVPDGSKSWMKTHAALPVPVRLEGDLFRIFFSGRADKNRSHVGYVDVEIGVTPRVHAVSATPVLAPGGPGSFDDSGIGLGCIVAANGSERMYYMGWNLGVTAPWRNSIGMAVGRTDSARFERFSEGPIMDRSPADPFTLSYPWVLRDRSGTWRAWYGSNLRWGAEIADMNHAIKHATSDDGIDWKRDGRVVVGSEDATTIAVARPCVVEDADGFRMWYAYRGDAYRIGYAESPDGIAWTRHDAVAGIAPSESGWDSKMICYPCVFDHVGERYMLYNGNGYGATGFGLAVLDKV